MWFRALGLGYQLLIVGGILLALSAALWRIHHNIDKGGYDRAMAEVTAAAAKRDKEAAANIAETRKKYAEKTQKLRQSPDYMRPACPLVGSVIDSLPEPSAPRK